jgi:hypothetical protein
MRIEPGAWRLLNDIIMAMRTVGIFVSGFVAGWVGRSVAGSTREAAVRTLVALEALRSEVTRLVAEQIERWQDLFAEGRAHYDAERARAPFDDAQPPRVVPIRERAGTA